MNMALSNHYTASLIDHKLCLYTPELYEIWFNIIASNITQYLLAVSSCCTSHILVQINGGGGGAPQIFYC